MYSAYTYYHGKRYDIYDAFFEGEGGPAYGEFHFHEKEQLRPTASAASTPAAIPYKTPELPDIKMPFLKKGV